MGWDDIWLDRAGYKKDVTGYHEICRDVLIWN